MKMFATTAHPLHWRVTGAAALLACALLGGKCEKAESQIVPSAEQPAPLAAETIGVSTAPATRSPLRTPPTTRTWMIDGVERTALVSAPEPSASDEASPYPIVFVFHGHGGGSRQVRRSYNADALWPEAMFVYPQGLPTPGQITDPEGRRSGWHSARTAEAMGNRDYKFFDAMLADFLAEGGDRTRVYATGHSNGGGFSYSLAAQRGDRLAAIAPSAASFSRGDAVVDVAPIPVMHIGGRNDPLVKWQWQEASILAARRINQCGEDPEPFGDDGAMIYRSDQGTPVVVYVTDGDHAFESGAVPSIVAFFKKCRRAPVTVPQ